MNPEQKVIDEIDKLVEEQLTHTPDDYSKNEIRYVKCALCGQQWHGLPNFMNCPGENATPAEAEVWRQAHSKSVESQHDCDDSNGTFLLDRDSGQRNWCPATYYAADGQEVRGTVVFTGGEGHTIWYFIPTESDDSDQRNMLTAAQFEGINSEVADAWEAIARQQLSDIRARVDSEDDTP